MSFPISTRQTPTLGQLSESRRQFSFSFLCTSTVFHLAGANKVKWIQCACVSFLIFPPFSLSFSLFISWCMCVCAVRQNETIAYIEASSSNSVLFFFSTLFCSLVCAFSSLGLIEHCRLSGIHIYELKMAWALWTNNKSDLLLWCRCCFSAFKIRRCVHDARSMCGCMHVCLCVWAYFVWMLCLRCCEVKHFCQCTLTKAGGWCWCAFAGVFAIYLKVLHVIFVSTIDHLPSALPLSLAPFTL